MTVIVLQLTCFVNRQARADNIELPFPNFPLAPTEIMNTVTYKLDKPGCIGTAVFSRNLIIYLPKSAVFFREANINRFYQNALDALERICSVNQGMMVNSTLTFVQNKNLIYRIGTTADANNNNYRQYITSQENLDLIRETQRKYQLERAAYWQTIYWRFKLFLTCITLLYAAYYAPRTLAYIRYVLSPHPANTIITRATKRDKSIAVNGRELANALRNVPKGSTGRVLATRDLNEMAVRTDEEIAYLRAAEKLARKTFEMEDARVIRDELAKRKDNS